MLGKVLINAEDGDSALSTNNTLLVVGSPIYPKCMHFSTCRVLIIGSYSGILLSQGSNTEKSIFENNYSCESCISE